MYSYMYMYMCNKTVSAAVLVYSGIDSLYMYIMCLQLVSIMKCMCTCNSWYVILKGTGFNLVNQTVLILVNNDRLCC